MNTLTLDNMKETYINETGTNRAMDEVWDTFYKMTCWGFIPMNLWHEFTHWAYSLYVDCNDCVVDRDTDEIIYCYTEQDRYEA